MADRIHVWHYVLNEEGQPIIDTNVRLYLYGTTTEANIYLSKTASSYTTCSVADIKTDSNGFFEFWLAGNWESGGYDFTQRFRLVWNRPGIKRGYINNFNPWPNILTWVNTSAGSDADYNNKFISNTLINTWLTHVSGSQPIPSASIHGISAVDYSSGCSNDDYNKTVSNEFIRDIIAKCQLNDSISLSGSLFSGGSEITEYTATVPSGTWNTVPSASWMVSGSPTPSGYTYYYKDFYASAGAPVASGAYVFLANTSTYEEKTPTRVFFITSGGGDYTRILVNEDITVRVSINGY